MFLFTVSLVTVPPVAVGPASNDRPGDSPEFRLYDRTGPGSDSIDEIVRPSRKRGDVDDGGQASVGGDLGETSKTEWGGKRKIGWASYPSRG